jgi:hypothetical protein
VRRWQSRWKTRLTDELDEPLSEGRLDERKAAVAREILSRRQQTKAEAIKRQFGWLGGVVAALGLVFVAVRVDPVKKRQLVTAQLF